MKNLDLFDGETPVRCFESDAEGFLIAWARKHRKEPFNPEDAIYAASQAGITVDDNRRWGAVFKQCARDGYIRRAGLFQRTSSNGSARPGWQGV